MAIGRTFTYQERRNQTISVSFLDPDPGNLSIFVTNKTNGEKEIRVRLRGDKLQEYEVNQRNQTGPVAEIWGARKLRPEEKGSSTPSLIKAEYTNEEVWSRRQVFSCLNQGGFTFLPHEQPTPFAVEGSDRSMYISVYDTTEKEWWCLNMPVHPKQYGCVAIKEDDRNHISVLPHNPEPLWFQTNNRNPTFPNDAIRVHERSDGVAVYLAKVTYIPSPGEMYLGALLANVSRVIPDHEYATGVWKENGELCRVKKYGSETDGKVTLDLLLAKKYEWVRAQRGDKMPANAVKTNVTITRFAGSEERYVGRLGGEMICAVSITDGNISHFTAFNGVENFSGDILLLTDSTC